MSKFTSWDDYQKFALQIKQSRYFHRPSVARFLEAVRCTAMDRVIDLEKDWDFCRAQSGYRGKRSLLPHTAQRMKPQPDKAVEGRVNAKGDPCLYGARNPQTAIAEIRPRKGELVSVAVLKFCRTVKVVECLRYPSKLSGKVSIILRRPGSDFDGKR
jgi:hypothetical protein